MSNEVIDNKLIEPSAADIERGVNPHAVAHANGGSGSEEMDAEVTKKVMKLIEASMMCASTGLDITESVTNHINNDFTIDTKFNPIVENMNILIGSFKSMNTLEENTNVEVIFPQLKPWYDNTKGLTESVNDDTSRMMIGRIIEHTLTRMNGIYESATGEDKINSNRIIKAIKTLQESFKVDKPSELEKEFIDIVEGVNSIIK